MAASPAKIMSIFGGSRRHGRWRVPEKTSVLALCGRCVIDLRDATADGEDIRISVTSVFASVLLLVPEGADVLPSGTAVLASAACLVPQSDAEATLPPVRVESMTVLGKLRIQVISDEEAGIEKKHWWRRRKAQPQPSVLPAQPAEQPAPTLQVQTPPAEQYAPVPRDPYPEREPRYEVVTQRQAPEPQDDFFSDPAPSPAASDDDLTAEGDRPEPLKLHP